MKNLLVVTALLEALTGVALVVWPAPPVSLLVGVALDAPGGLIVARIAQNQCQTELFQRLLDRARHHVHHGPARRQYDHASLVRDCFCGVRRKEQG